LHLFTHSDIGRRISIVFTTGALLIAAAGYR